jgi:hypothetical protein
MVHLTGYECRSRLPGSYVISSWFWPDAWVPCFLYTAVHGILADGAGASPQQDRLGLYAWFPPASFHRNSKSSDLVRHDKPRQLLAYLVSVFRCPKLYWPCCAGSYIGGCWPESTGGVLDYVRLLVPLQVPRFCVVVFL